MKLNKEEKIILAALAVNELNYYADLEDKTKLDEIYIKQLKNIIKKIEKEEK